MEEKAMLLDLKKNIERLLKKLDDQIILYDPRDNDEEFDFLIKKARSYRDNLRDIDKRLAEL